MQFITKKDKFKKGGFTLIELLVVISIIGLLSGLTLVSLNDARIKARDANRISDLHQIRLALELYFDSNGEYPNVTCGYDCNGYYVSNDANWNTLITDLAPFIMLPSDPINTPGPCTGPWTTGCLTYSYGNVGRDTYSPTYDLTAQLEFPNHLQSCGVNGWTYDFDDKDWCGLNSSQIYEASRD